jgi:hypothetical protein
MFRGQQPVPEHFGGEDDFQERMRKVRYEPCYSVASWVYHYKDVTMGTAKHGRMGLKEEHLPRLKPVDAGGKT